MLRLYSPEVTDARVPLQTQDAFLSDDKFNSEQPEPDHPFLLPSRKEQRSIFRWFFFVVLILLIYQLLRIMSLFSDVIIWAASLSLVFIPVHQFLQRCFPKRRNTPAALSTMGVLLLVLLPILMISWVVIQQSAQLYPTVNQWVTEFRAEGSGYFIGLLPDFMQDYWQRVNAYIGQSAFLSKFDFEQFALSNIDAVSGMIGTFGAAMARNILIGVVNLLLILILMFFCFRDGERFLHWLFEIVPLPTDHVESVAARIYQTVTAVIRGALLTAGAQGALAMIGYLIAGVPLAVFFGVVTGIAAMIPVVGAGLIWAPIGIFIFTQSPGWGIFIFIWGFFVVSLVDNLLKPILIGSRARMPILLIFCGIIGGVNVYGVTGVIIGPILIAVLLAFITIYRETYLSETNKQADNQSQLPATD
jgi:predicted PurR-regulated permease PerM